jgi:hypothetical protein
MAEEIVEFPTARALVRLRSALERAVTLRRDRFWARIHGT